MLVGCRILLKILIFPTGSIFKLHIFTEYSSRYPQHFLTIWCKNINHDRSPPRSYSQKGKIMVGCLPRFIVLHCIFTNTSVFQYKQLLISVENELKEALSLDIIVLQKPGFALKSENKAALEAENLGPCALKNKAPAENKEESGAEAATDKSIKFHYNRYEQGAVEINPVSGDLRARVLDLAHMMYQTLAWVLPQVKAEDGDVIEFKPATAFEIRYDAGPRPVGHKREFLDYDQ